MSKAKSGANGNAATKMVTKPNWITENRCCILSGTKKSILVHCKGSEISMASINIPAISSCKKERMLIIMRLLKRFSMNIILKMHA